jgi:DNA-binding NarL/FixJ family response regulator
LRIRLVGDVALAEHGLDSMLSHYAEVVTVLTRASSCAAPDLILHDPFQRGVDATGKHLRLDGLACPWVVWSWDRQRCVSPRPGVVAPAGYLFKGARAPRLVAELLRVDAGEFVVSRGDRATPAESWAGQRYGLTPRQSDVLVAIADGWTNAEIAHKLSLSPNTVKSYIRLAYQIIGASSRRDAVLWTSAHGLRQATKSPMSAY